MWADSNFFDFLRHRTMKHKLIYHTHISANDCAAVSEVTTITDEGEYNLTLSAIARDGLTLNCDRQTLDSILPNFCSVSPRQPKVINTRFCLSKHKRKSNTHIEAPCEVFCVRRLSRDTYQLELKFKSLAEEALDSVDKFIDRRFKDQTEAKAA